MADWVTCAGCHLRHTQRADGLCPRCKQPVDAVAASPPPSPPPVSPSALPSLRPPVAAFAAEPALASPSAARLGNLAQAARGKAIRNARGIMLFIGIASMLVNGFFFVSAASDVQSELDKEIGKLGPNFVVDPVKLAGVKAQAVRTTHLITFGGIFLGAIFVGCGVLVERHPVPITVAALALYLGGNAIFAVINPASLGAGMIMKIFIVIALFKAVQAAIAYQKELATTAVAA
jgi:hypothetical protein